MTAIGAVEMLKRLFLADLFFGDFGPPQQSPARQELRLLSQNSLQKRNGVAKIAQLDRRDRFEPMTALCFAQFFLCFGRHN